MITKFNSIVKIKIVHSFKNPQFQHLIQHIKKDYLVMNLLCL